MVYINYFSQESVWTYDLGHHCLIVENSAEYALAA